MTRYAVLMGIIMALAGCGGGAYYGGYSYPYDTYPYYYDNLYGPPYTYPYPGYYHYYSIPPQIHVPGPGFHGEHEERERGEFHGGRGGGGEFRGGGRGGDGRGGGGGGHGGGHGR